MPGPSFLQKRKKPTQPGNATPGQDSGWKVGQQGFPDSPLEHAIAGYKHDRDTHKRKGSKTRKHENTSFNRWGKYSQEIAKEKATKAADQRPDRKLEMTRSEDKNPDANAHENQPLDGIHLKDIDGKLLKDFTTWRIETAEEAGRQLSGRAINLNVLALKHVIDWAVVDRWLPEFPRGWVWEDLPEKPKDVRLIEPSELDFLASANLLDPEALKMIDKRVRHLREAQGLSGQAFHDYVYLLAYSGGREQETIAKKWSHVKWDRKVLFFPGNLAKAGGGEPAKDRDVDFHAKLEDHIKAMQDRRDPSSDYMFPGPDGGHQGSFRKQWETARTRLKAWYIENGRSEKEAAELCDDLGFHHLRHYFISHGVMAGIDFMTIAVWVSHRDGGVLIGKKYGHLRPGHSQNMARKLDNAF